MAPSEGKVRIFLKNKGTVIAHDVRSFEVIDIGRINQLDYRRAVAMDVPVGAACTAAMDVLHRLEVVKAQINDTAKSFKDQVGEILKATEEGGDCCTLFHSASVDALSCCEALGQMVAGLDVASQEIEELLVRHHPMVKTRDLAEDHEAITSADAGVPPPVNCPAASSKALPLQDEEVTLASLAADACAEAEAPAASTAAVSTALPLFDEEVTVASLAADACAGAEAPAASTAAVGTALPLLDEEVTLASLAADACSGAEASAASTAAVGIALPLLDEEVSTSAGLAAGDAEAEVLPPVASPGAIGTALQLSDRETSATAPAAPPRSPDPSGPRGGGNTLGAGRWKGAILGGRGTHGCSGLAREDNGVGGFELAKRPLEPEAACVLVDSEEDQPLVLVGAHGDGHHGHLEAGEQLVAVNPSVHMQAEDQLVKMEDGEGLSLVERVDSAETIFGYIRDLMQVNTNKAVHPYRALLLTIEAELGLLDEPLRTRGRELFGSVTNNPKFKANTLSSWRGVVLEFATNLKEAFADHGVEAELPEMPTPRRGGRKRKHENAAHDERKEGEASSGEEPLNLLLESVMAEKGKAQGVGRVLPTPARATSRRIDANSEGGA